MALVMYRTYEIPSRYTDDEKVVIKKLIDNFRLRSGDDIPKNNILFDKSQRYPDGKIVSFLESATADINGSGIPLTSYTLIQLCSINESLVLLGSLVNMCLSEGLFQTANGIDFSDSGLSIGMYNKSGQYQGWYGQLLQLYQMEKANFKAGVISNSPNAGFVSIGSEFGYRGGYGYY